MAKVAAQLKMATLPKEVAIFSRVRKTQEKQSFSELLAVENCSRWPHGQDRYSGRKMDIPTLLHTLTIDGLTLRAAGNSLEVAGEISKLTLEQQRALKEHKPTLLVMLKPPPHTTCYLPELRDAGEEFDAILAGQNDMQFADSLEAEQPLLRCMEYFQRLADKVKFHNPERLSQIVLEYELQPEPCRRCGNFRTYLAIIHAGESLRRDCSQCGRFVSFPSWNNRELTAKILAAIVSDNRYNEAGHSNAANAQAALTQNLSIPKEPR